MTITNLTNILEAYETVTIKEDLKPYIKSIAEFFEHNNVSVTPLPSIKFVERDGGISTPTGRYDISDNPTITLFIKNRHYKDILRSYAHELYHHHQYLSNPEKFCSIQCDCDVNNNDELELCERDAYENGNILFRKWTEEQFGRN